MQSIHTLIDQYFEIKPGQFLVLGMPAEGQEYEFSSHGCDIIRPLANSVVEVNYVIFEGDNAVVSEGTVRVSSYVLDAFHNGTEYLINESGHTNAA